MAKTYYYKGQEILTPYNIYDNRTVFTNESLNKKRTHTFIDGQRFDMNFAVKPSHDPSQIMLAHISGFHETDTMVFPQGVGLEDKRTYNGTLAVKNAATAGQDQITVNSQSGHGANKIIPAGYFIKFQGHSKIYMVTEELNLNNGADKTLKIYPKLQKNVAAANEVKLGDDVIYTYERDIKTARGISFSGGVLTNPGTINLVEKV